MYCNFSVVPLLCMITFYICRHGETENNKNRLFSGWVDTPLTSKGIKNAISSAAKLKDVEFDAIVSSDLGRAFITAYIIARNNNFTGEISCSSQLREVNYGVYNNTPHSGPESTYPTIETRYYADYVNPGGESLRQLQTRVLSYIDNLSKKLEDKVVLIVAHSGTITALSAHYRNEDVGLVDRVMVIPHDYVARFEYDSGDIKNFAEIK